MTYTALGRSAQAMLEHYLRHADEFVEDLVIAGRKDEHGREITLDAKQREVLHELALGNWPVLQKARGTGGTTDIAWAVIWWLYVHATAKVICTAPKVEQIEINLWPEIKRWLSGSLIEQDFEWTKKKIFLAGREQQNFAVMQTAAEPEGLQGAHDPFLLIVVEEASGVRDASFDALMGSLTQKYNALIIVYNPTKNSGFAIDKFRHPHGRFRAVHMPAYDPETQWRHPLVQEEQIQSLRRYGESSPQFRIFALGLPPLTETDAAVPWEWVNEASELTLPVPREYRRLWGIDPSVTGDRVGFCERVGAVVTKIEAWRSMGDTVRLSGSIIRRYEDLAREQRPNEVIIDRLGVGWGVADQCAQAGLPVVPIAASQAPSVKVRFLRLRDELWWTAREWFESRAVAIPDDQEFVEEITTPRYSLTSDGKVRVESKQDYRKRFDRQRSPDKADAFMLTFAGGLQLREEHLRDAYDEDDSDESGVSWVGAW